MGKGSIVRGDELIMQLRMVKSPAEIACLKKAERDHRERT